MAFAVLLLHWLLLFGWGLALNDSAGGFQYCRLAMPGHGHTLPWVFTAAGVVALLVLGQIDRKRRTMPLVIAFGPVVLFAATQLFAWSLNVTSIRE